VNTYHLNDRMSTDLWIHLGSSVRAACCHCSIHHTALVIMRMVLQICSELFFLLRTTAAFNYNVARKRTLTCNMFAMKRACSLELPEAFYEDVFLWVHRNL
jgi:hypothetical protein